MRGGRYVPETPLGDAALDRADTARTCPSCGHPNAKHYALGALGCHNLGCDCTRLASGNVAHGVHEYDARWVSFCQYHGLIASAPIREFVQNAWSRHLTRDCLIPTVETRASTLIDHEGNLAGYVIPVEMWREVRALLQRADGSGAPS